MYREYRDTTRAGAITQAYREMGARHQTRTHSIQIIRIDQIAAGKTRRPHMQQFHVRDVLSTAATHPAVQDSKIKFPLPHRRTQTTPSTFAARRPSTTF